MKESREKWIKKIWYIHKTEHYSAIKKNKRMLFAVTWMDPEIMILSEVNQTQKDKYDMVSLMCGILKQGTNEHIYKTDVDSWYRKQTVVTRGKGRV